MSAVTFEKEVPEFITQWTEELEYDPLSTPNDQLDVLGARLASVRFDFRSRSKSDAELIDITTGLETDLDSWSVRTQAAGSACKYEAVHDPTSPNSWHGTRHEYVNPEALRFWNKFRCYCIALSRLQEELWRRSWSLPGSAVPEAEHYSTRRNQMQADICVATATLLGNDAPVELPQAAMGNAYPLILPLMLAGTCLLEQLITAVSTPGGSRTILVDGPLHLDRFDERSTQLAWVIARLDWIAEKVGIRWAAATAKWLRGDESTVYDVPRS